MDKITFVSLHRGVSNLIAKIVLYCFKTNLDISVYLKGEAISNKNITKNLPKNNDVRTRIELSP